MLRKSTSAIATIIMAASLSVFTAAHSSSHRPAMRLASSSYGYVLAGAGGPSTVLALRATDLRIHTD
jgi:hypothetical protein